MELEQIHKELTETKKEYNNNSSFAIEMLREQRANNRLKDRIIIAVLLLWFATIVLFVSYLNSYEYSSVTEYVDIEATQDGSGTNTVVGGDYEYGANG